MTYGKYLAECGRVYQGWAGKWRKGQTYFNVLWQERPDLSKKIRGTDLDCFYMDERIPAFLEWVRNNW